VREAEGHRHDGIRQHEYGFGFLANGQARDPEDETEYDNLQHVAPSHGVDDARGKRVHDDSRKGEGLNRGGGVCCQGHVVTGAKKHRCKPAEQEGDRGRDLEENQRLPTEPAKVLHAAHATDGAHQHAE